MTTRSCVYAQFGGCQGRVRLYAAGWLCQEHGHPQPAPDPTLTANGLRERVVPGRDAEALVKLHRAQQLRDERLQQVESKADPGWLDHARRAVWWCANNRPEFTVDDVWARLGQMGVLHPTEPRALGPVMMRAMRAKAIEDTGRMAKSTRRNASKITVYRKAQP